MIHAIIFDYFGVVRPDGAGLRSIYRYLGGDVQKDEPFIADVTSAANYGFIKDAEEELAKHLGISMDQWNAAAKIIQRKDPAVLAYILELRQRGLKIGLLSNAGKGMLPQYFAPDDLNTYFDYFVSSGDVGLVKPEAAFYRLMAEYLDATPEECVMVDDREAFVTGATFIGMQGVHYQHFDQFKNDLEALLAANPDASQSEK